MQNYQDKLMTFTWQLYIDAKNYCIDINDKNYFINIDHNDPHNYDIESTINHKLYLMISIL